MGSIHEVIEALRQEPSNSERRTALEELMVRYFELDPVLAGKYDEVSRRIDSRGLASGRRSDVVTVAHHQT